MKKMISYALFAAMAFFASCSQDETLEQATNAPGVLSFTTSLPNDGIQTKAADANVGRYIMQLYTEYEGEMTAQYLNPEGTDDTTQKLLVQDNGTFTIDGATINLTEGTTYTAVFWADYDTPAAADPTYNANYLNCVQLNSGKEMTMAYCGTADFTYGSDMPATQSVTLKRAVAQVNLNQSVAFTAAEGDQLTATYTRYFAYDALNTCVYPTSEGWQTNPSVTTTLSIAAGEKAANSTLGNILVFASADEAINTDFTFAYNGITVGNATQAPLQANYQTNINGNFSTPASGNTSTTFEVATDDQWSGSNDSNLTPGEAGGDEEEPATDTTAPVLGDAIVTTDGLTITYSIPVTHATSLANGWGKIQLYDESWANVIGEEYPSFGADATTAYTMTGSFTVESAGTYHISYAAYLTNDIYAYDDYQNITVTE